MWDFTSWPRDQTHIPCIGRLQSLGREEPLEEELATTHSSILAWRIPWTEDPGVLWSMGSQRAGHDWVTNTALEAWSLSLWITREVPNSSVFRCKTETQRS